MVRTSALLRYVPLIACLLVAVGLLWWQPPRAVSATLVVIAYLSVCAHLWRSRLKPAQHSSGPVAEALLLIGYASQGGTARELAERSANQLREAGVAVDVRALNAVDHATLGQTRRALFVLSTYGEGEAPDNAARFEQRLLNATIDLASLEYALLALGDHQYRHFCGFGRRTDARLRSLGARPLFDRLEADCADPGALRHWQQQLGHISGRSDFTDWQPAVYQPWELQSRILLNPGSQGAPVYQLILQPLGAMPPWQAGDIAEVGPRNAPTDVEHLLHQLGFDPSQLIDQTETLAATLADRRLPAETNGCNLATLLALPRLPHREYSIASIPADGQVTLLVREAQLPDGRVGLGSGWLCRHAPIGSRIDLRIRSNPGFHATEPTRPMILIGNGTGIAGLHAHLRERAATPGSRNWLLYGERSAAHDQLLMNELRAWKQSGHLHRLDLAFSRDQPAKVYVQHLLRDAADDVRSWIAAGGAIYVCGSLEGMGREVQQILVGLLGEKRLQSLTEQGRYRRDLY